jgi:hypothetical protein
MYSLIKSKYETVRKFADAAKLEYTNVHKWTSTKNITQPNLDIVLAIAKMFPSVNMRNLLIGSGDYMAIDTPSLIMNEEAASYTAKSDLLSITISNQQMLIDMLSQENEKLKIELDRCKSKK